MTSKAAPAADFSCAICLDTATEPVVTRCGHLFCWECLDHWLHSAAGAPECPVCKGRVDERLAGDIIPLYGKGKQSTNKPGSGPHAAPTAADIGSSAAVPAAAATEAAAVDPGQEAFFSRPSAYSFAPGRDARRASVSATATATAAGGRTQEEHHPRPSADRAPPRPRPPPQQHPNSQMHMHTHGMPLTVGSTVFFLGGGGNMFFSILLIVAWAVYHYAPWWVWRDDLTRWYRHMRGDPVPEERHNGAASNNNNANANANANARTGEAQGGVADGPNGLPSQQMMLRNQVVALLAIFVLFQFLLM